ncbi:hypothetical protein AQUCO_00100661v1 [Aquilegia coerulea]|uniref:Ubiquitin-like protease family profile domain-containing protein n=1 Tax=Aquilegia coerulea TaxID=218851 RepID=A0A2G5FBD6_AQUCA|nr:hypothetical protein AQUCO_00100661v1 [Aquilegia coerulea]
MTRGTSELTNMEILLPYVVFAADPSQVQLKLDMKWKREYVKCVEQLDSCSCGLFLLAFVECVFRGIPPQFDADPLQMRYRIARDLIDIGESLSSKNKSKV